MAVYRLVTALQVRQSRGGGNGVTRERSGLVHRTERGEQAHDVGPATERADRKATADHLAEGQQVRLPTLIRAVEPVHPGAAQPKAGHHLVGDQ